MSNALTLARPYARAAFALAREHDQLSQWSMRLGFSAQIALDPRVQALLSHPKLEADEAVALLMPPGAPDPLFTQFLAVLTDNGRLALLPEIAALYAQQRAEAEHVVKATITSATVLDAVELGKLHDALKRRFDAIQYYHRGPVATANRVTPAAVDAPTCVSAGEGVFDGPSSSARRILLAWR